MLLIQLFNYRLLHLYIPCPNLYTYILTSDAAPANAVLHTGKSNQEVQGFSVVHTSCHTGTVFGDNPAVS